jgi:beta-fructofuranosidase
VWREGADWMLALGSGLRGQGGAVLLYRSSDLRHWTYLHPLLEGKAKAGSSANPVDSGEMWECPDFFPLGGRHVLLISTAGKVLWHVGKYEQRRFQPEKTGVVDSGAYYAARTMLDREGNRVLWGWIPERRPESEYRAAGWAGVMSLPRLLSLAADGSLRMEPEPALCSLRGRNIRIAPAADLAAFQAELARLRIQHPALELAVELASTRAFRMQLVLHDEPLADVDYQPDRRGSELRLNHVLASLPLAKSKSTALRLFLDGSVIELFAAGKTVITDRVYKVPDSSLHINVDNTPASLEIWQMNPISPDRLTS